MWARGQLKQEQHCNRASPFTVVEFVKHAVFSMRDSSQHPPREGRVRGPAAHPRGGRCLVRGQTVSEGREYSVCSNLGDTTNSRAGPWEVPTTSSHTLVVSPKLVISNNLGRTLQPRKAYQKSAKVKFPLKLTFRTLILRIAACQAPVCGPRFVVGA